jgi:hypothetical protein
MKRAPDGCESVYDSRSDANGLGRNHVIFDNSSAYPEYVITVKKTW